MPDLSHLEVRRLELEENVAKLRKSLQQWRTWDAEYEGLKEELQTGVSVRTEEDCKRISNDFAGILVNEKEILELFRVGKGPVRQPTEVIKLLEKRLDYVQQNVATIATQMNSAENQLAEVLEKMDRDNDDPEGAGLPMTEIIEELDEDGNVISSKITQPENATAQIIETLRKAGLTGMDSKSGSADAKADKPDLNKDEKPTSSSDKSTTQAKALDTAEAAKETGVTPSGLKPPARPGFFRKKSVTFADTTEEKEIPIDAAESLSPVKTNFIGTFPPNERVIELNEEDAPIGASVVIPDDESPEDAQLRREMLQYNLNEVGQVVAELDLDENLSDFEDDDFEFEDEYEDSEIEEEEDEHGRSIRRGVSKDYRKQMQDLEEKLRGRVIANLGPNGEEINPIMDPDELRRLVIRQEDGGSAVATELAKGKERTISDASEKKGVHFSNALDVQEAPKAPEPPVQPKPKTAPIADIVERVPSKQAPASEPAKLPAKVSRFKQNKQTASAVPAMAENGGPKESTEGPILSQTIVERPAPSTNVRAPEEEDEFDPELQQRQLASEYYRMRNNIIQSQGGFKASEEDDDNPIMEEVDGKVKKMSRFKAARMKF